ncbi:hypothetical protein GINT2_001564 [Glugoides intestinalis]
MDYQKQFEIFMQSTGDAVSRLLHAGYAVESLKEGDIATLEDFVKIVNKKECVEKLGLKMNMRKLYKNHISLEDLKKFLRVGEDGFDETRMKEAIRILPLNEDGGLSIDDLIEFLYK